MSHNILKIWWGSAPKCDEFLPQPGSMLPLSFIKKLTNQQDTGENWFKTPLFKIVAFLLLCILWLWIKVSWETQDVCSSKQPSEISLNFNTLKSFKAASVSCYPVLLYTEGYQCMDEKVKWCWVQSAALWVRSDFNVDSSPPEARDVEIPSSTDFIAAVSHFRI